ncbi:MAG: glutamate--tRNA ligase family protein, partial [Acidobacteria bacterium]|nr:glutamate--tRNA ligase family protein [Acidobacteriota bacterium]
QKLDRYRAAAEALVERGHAYRDYATADELGAERQAAEREKRRFIYSRRWMAETAAERERYEAEGRQGVVRLQMPREGLCRFRDLIRGEVEFEWAREQDHVILRADGTPIYHLASVVDDHDMEISHVIRAEEHLSNTPRQIFIAQSLGYELPSYAHLPVVAEPGSKTKLSKRKLDKYLRNPDFARMYEHGRAIAEAIGLEMTVETFNPVVVDFYREVGYLPEAIVNYLLLLGWSLDDHTEFLSREESIENFSLERVGKSSASFDPQKLMAFQEHYMKLTPLEQRLEMVLPFLIAAGLLEVGAVESSRPRVRDIVEAAGDRLVVAGDILNYREFFVGTDDFAYDEAGLEKRLRSSEGAADLLAGFRDELATAEAFDAATLEQSLRDYVAARDVKLGQVIHALRVAVTGKTVGFGMFEILEILGRDACVARIDRALALVGRG